MTERVDFEGTLVRIEPYGFGVVKFDEALGANTHGIVSSSLSEPSVPFARLRKGLHVRGTAEIDERSLAAIKTLSIATSG